MNNFQNFWQTLPAPVIALAPMDDVTDLVFRDMVDRAGGPMVYISEFVSAERMLKGDGEALRRLEFRQNHRPMVAQIWGNNPEDYYKGAMELHRRGFDGIDINMGCPQKKITKKGACSGLINNPALAAELIAAAQEGTQAAFALWGDSHEGPPGRIQRGGAIPVSVKTRIGFTNVQTEQWCGFLLQRNLPLLTVHGRTSAQQSEGEADWNEISRTVALRDSISPGTLVFGNGDVVSFRQFRDYAEKYGVDGIMVGRGIFRNLYIFADKDFHSEPVSRRISWALRHLKAYRDAYEGRRNFEIMKKFFKIYLSDFEGADELRERIMLTHSYDDAEMMLKQAF